MRVAVLVAAALAAFAGNSLLCRLALRGTGTDPASFTAIRLLSGAVALSVLVGRRIRPHRPGGSWGAAAALFLYAAAFAFAYAGLPAGTGALLLFGAVQATLIGHALWRGERLAPGQWLGLVLACAGLLGLLLPGAARPSPLHAALMLVAGGAWGVYTLRGRGVSEPTIATAGNFLRTVPFAAVLLLLGGRAADPAGVAEAVLSGVVASGLGYALWYAVLPSLSGTVAATVQLAVPALAALAAVPLLDEPLTARLLLSAAAVLGGIAMVLAARPRPSGS